MLTRIFWFFCLSFLHFTTAVPHAPARWNSPRADPAQLLIDCPHFPGMVFPLKGCVTYRDVVVKGGYAEVRKAIDVPLSDKKTKLRVQATRKGISEVFQFYALHLKNNLPKDLHVNLTMVRHDKVFRNPKSTGSTTADRSGQHCYVVIKVFPDKPLIWVPQVIAHELYHCVQFQEDPGREEHTGDLQWVVDGSANFFAYLQYPFNPSSVVDDGAPHYYEPGVALYEQQYSSCLFFHFLHNSKWSLEQIDTWVRQRKQHDESGELVALAGDTAVANAFGEFAKSFYQKRIYFDAQKTLRINTDMETGYEVPTEPLEDINIPAVGVDIPFDLGKITSWTFKKYSVMLQPKQTVATTITWKNPTAPNVVVWSRNLRQGKKPSTWVKSLPKVHSGCDTSPVIYEFLVVPVADVKEVEGSLHFTREKDAECSCPVKKPGSQPIKRTPAIDVRNLDPIVARQQGNNSGSCAVSSIDLTPSLVPLPTHTMNVAEVIESIMGISSGQIVTSTNTGQASHPTTICNSALVSPAAKGNGTTRMSKLTPWSWPSQKSLTPIPPSFPTEANSRITVSNRPAETSPSALLSQSFETTYTLPPTYTLSPTTVQETPTPTPSTTVDPPVDEDWPGEDEEWDGTWPLPEGGAVSADPDTETTDTEPPPEDDDESCDRSSCLIGTWNADKASMDAHSLEPNFRYDHPGFDRTKAKFSATYKLVFRDDPSADQPTSISLMSLFLHEELTEEGHHTSTDPEGNNGMKFYHTVSTSIIDSKAVISGSMVEDHEVGTLYKSSETTTSTGEVKISRDGGPLYSWLPTGGKGYGPSENGFDYNCTGNTLNIQSKVGIGRRKSKHYVFQRG